MSRLSDPTDAPEDLVPVDLERELLAGIFRASAVVEEVPTHAGAAAGLVLIRHLDARDLCIREHRDVLEAVQHVLRNDGTASPTFVRDELRSRGAVDALRLLPHLVAPGTAYTPVASIPKHAERIRAAARARRRYRRAQDVQAKVLDRGRRRQAVQGRKPKGSTS